MEEKEVITFLVRKLNIIVLDNLALEMNKKFFKLPGVFWREGTLNYCISRIIGTKLMFSFLSILV